MGLTDETKSSPKPVDQFRLQYVLQQARDNQNLGMGILGGFAAAVVGALVWAGVTYLLHWQIGIMAVGVGFLVGYAVREFGSGVDMVFGVVGGVFSLLGCLVGNLLTVCVVIARDESLGVMDVISRVSPAIAVELLVDTFHPMDLLFYGLAVYYGYKYSFRQVTGQETGQTALRP